MEKGGDHESAALRERFWDNADDGTEETQRSLSNLKALARF
jgi:hypothetical protein